MSHGTFNPHIETRWVILFDMTSGSRILIQLLQLATAVDVTLAVHTAYRISSNNMPP